MSELSRKEVIEKLNEALRDPKVPGYYTIALQEVLRLLEQDEAQYKKTSERFLEAKHMTLKEFAKSAGMKIFFGN